MAFFHVQAPTIQPIQPLDDHSHSTSGKDELDVETTLIAKLSLDGHTDSFRLPSVQVDEVAYRLQNDQCDQWLSIKADAKLAKNIDGARVTDAAYLDLDAFITADASTASELLSHGKALPVPKSCQTHLEDPNFIMNPELITVPEMEDTQSDQAGSDVSNDDVVKNDETLDNLNESMVGEQIESDRHQIHVPSSGSTAQSKHSNAVFRVNCIICHEFCRNFEALKTPCDHHYCKNCLVALVEAFTRDESLFPLRCCQDPIPVSEVLPTLSLALRSLFQQKNAEFSVLILDRLYCSNLDCSTFLGSSEGRLSVSTIECPHCLVNTCPRCKESAHLGDGCTVSALQALAMSQGWQTCPGCNAVVELNLGCYHMTCRCRAHFCYLCAARWKTCDCVQWDGARLMVAAQEGVENEVGHAAAARMPLSIEQRAAILRDKKNHPLRMPPMEVL